MSVNHCHKIFLAIYMVSCCVYSGRCAFPFCAIGYLLLFGFVPIFLFSWTIGNRVIKIVWSVISLLMFIPICWISVKYLVEFDMVTKWCPLQYVLRILYALFLSYLAIFHYKKN